ncbi:A disintegrin and metalloproteinase with thrombospondin motifs 7 [Oryzias latipes]|uniref:A disintegrin-like and metallopeptidase (reprolysin type) with thrombospondin type 1 motif, 7 n=1 Tax=Oryzias latipes TaxID=8090 RepID=H2L8J2_ORYLA|nr:A disintegrin and metalloproteinase with thrombospondin motifs 7 [Oryzias latipes]
MTRLDRGLSASGQRASGLHVFFTLVMVVGSSGAPHEPDRFLQSLPHYEVVHPTRVDAEGHFLSHFLPHHARRVQRRGASEDPEDLDQVFYQFSLGGHGLQLNLSLNTNLLAPGFLTERRYGGLKGAKIHHPGHSRCHYFGEVLGETTVKGSAAISTCDGLTGLFKFSDEEFFIQPLERSRDDTSEPQAHAIYKRHTSPGGRSQIIQQDSEKQSNASCGNRNSQHTFQSIESRRERWEHRGHSRAKRIHERSVSREKWVETLVVADSKMVDYHGSKKVESYVLAVMNIVAGLFRDSSIGNAINVVLVRLILLEQDEVDLKITHHADNSLNSFCKWQKKLNMKGDEHPLHHDVAVLLTRKDICATINTPCETLGLSHVAGMCQPHRSCSISEDTGLPMAFTVAHELGHNFGIQHDGNGNDCEPIGKRPFVMSPHLMYGTSLPRWSRCSRQYITRFLDRGWGWCLDDVPVKDRLSVSSVLPGQLYSAVHQCRLQYGSKSLLCDDMDQNICSTLWCTVGATCHSKLDGAVDGTSCGEQKWCIGGQCVAVGYQPGSIDGGWAPWSEWSACTRTCGAGVQSAERECDNPVPKHRGKYCLGERRRHRICNSAPCPQGVPTFRNMQCSHFNALPYKGKFYKWEAVINKVNPCELHCCPANEHFSEKMRDAVTDGTPCYDGNKSRDVCIDGVCQTIGCDFVINSNAVEDQCGVCNGNGSTCTTVRRTFEEKEGLGYVDIGLIPEGARNILIKEVAEAGNFLALRGDNPSRYFLNGGWTIQWTGEYKAAGATFTYERAAQLENLTSPGPTLEPLWIQLLFQETNPGVHYEYTISRITSEDTNSGSDYFWKYGSWTECSATCGIGVQRRAVFCVEKTTGLVEDHFCEPSLRPEDNHISCIKDPCPAIWWVGDWQKCSASCGSLGLTKRTVLCIQAVSAEEQKALEPSFCAHIPKPESISSCNTLMPCPADWNTGRWSKCSHTCGNGVRQRNVTCSRNTGVDCDPQKKPLAVTECYIQDCLQLGDNFGDSEGSGSGMSSNEVQNEINPIPELKTPLKPGRGQSRNPNVNFDFHYHNNIERTEENNVQVDDFYYDYNFIDFHEDLSEDFRSREKNLEDSHRLLSEVEQTHSVGADARVDTGNTTIAASAAPNVSDIYDLKHMEPQNITGDDIKHISTTENSKDANDFLSEDYLLPVSNTYLPPLSKTPRSQIAKGEHESVLWPESIITSGLLVTTEHPAQDETWEESGDETENAYDDSRAEENHSQGFTVTAVHPAPTRIHQTTTDITSTMEINSKSLSLEEKNDVTSKPLDQPAETEIPVRTGIHLKEIFQTTTAIPSAFTLEDLEMDPNILEAQRNSWDNDLSTLPPPSTFLPSLLLQTSGNQWVSENFRLLTGTENMPPTNTRGDAQPPATDVLTASVKAISPNPAFGKTTGTDSTYQPHLFYQTEYDYSEILDSSTVGSNINPDLIHQAATNTQATTQSSLTPAHHVEQATPTVPIISTNAPSLWPRTVPSSVEASGGAGHWVAGNWSACSTSCGLGAVWRAVTCSTGKDSDCHSSKKPPPARQCYLRPCSMWKVGEWSKCSKNCEGGSKFREVQCFDLRDQRPLRPFHCRAMSSRPQSQNLCNLQPCLDWYTSSWGQCSEVCGGGEQQRIVTCPEENGCEKDLQPSNIQSCNSQPCAQWLTGSWGECSASCGGGVQQRLIKCVDTKADTDTEVDQGQCHHELKPVGSQKCNTQECESASPQAVCLRDRLTARFCHTLHLLRRCHLSNVQSQCCKTCSQQQQHSSPLR